MSRQTKPEYYRPIEILWGNWSFVEIRETLNLRMFVAGAKNLREWPYAFQNGTFL